MLTDHMMSEYYSIDLGVPELTWTLAPHGFRAGRLLSLSGPAGAWKSKLAGHFASRARKALNTTCVWVDMEHSQSASLPSRGLYTLSMTDLPSLWKYLLKLPEECKLVVLDGVQFGTGEEKRGLTWLNLYMKLMGQGRTVITTWGTSRVPVHKALKFGSYLRLDLSNTDDMGLRVKVLKNAMSALQGHSFTLTREFLSNLETL